MHIYHWQHHHHHRHRHHIHHHHHLIIITTIITILFREGPRQNWIDLQHNAVNLGKSVEILHLHSRDPTIPVEMDPCYSWTFIESFWFVLYLFGLFLLISPLVPLQLRHSSFFSSRLEAKTKTLPDLNH